MGGFSCCCLHTTEDTTVQPRHKKALKAAAGSVSTVVEAKLTAPSSSSSSKQSRDNNAKTGVVANASADGNIDADVNTKAREIDKMSSMSVRGGAAGVPQDYRSRSRSALVSVRTAAVLQVHLPPAQIGADSMQAGDLSIALSGNNNNLPSCVVAQHSFEVTKLSANFIAATKVLMAINTMADTANNLAQGLPLVGQCVALVNTIVGLASQCVENNARAKELLSRVRVLERPLMVLQKECAREPAAYEHALIKLLGVLKDSERLVRRTLKARNVGRVAAFIKASNVVQDYIDINQRLDSSLLDLQVAMSATEAGSKDASTAAMAHTTAFYLAEQRRLTDCEAVLECVQCGVDFNASRNGEGHCRFHTCLARASSTEQTFWPCCNTTQNTYNTAITKGPVAGCKRGWHCAAHHLDYPYERFFMHCSEMRDNMAETWVLAEQDDFEDGFSKWALVGLANDGAVCFCCGEGGYCTYFETFDEDWLQDQHNQEQCTEEYIYVSQALMPSNPARTVGDWYVSGRFVRSEGGLGIEVEVKSMSSATPTVQLVTFTVNPAQMIEVSNRSPPPKAPPKDIQYFLPPAVRQNTPFPLSSTARDPMDPVLAGDLTHLRMKLQKPCSANITMLPRENDLFELDVLLIHTGCKNGRKGAATDERLAVLKMVQDGKISADDAVRLLNAMDAGTLQDDDLSIIDCGVEAFVEGKWVKSSALKLASKAAAKLPNGSVPAALPLQMAPGSLHNLSIASQVAAPGKDRTTVTYWDNRAYLSRLEPVKLRLRFEELSGKRAILEFEHVNMPDVWPSRLNTDLFFMALDDRIAWCRHYIRITSSEGDTAYVIEKRANINVKLRMTPKLLQQITFDACKAKAASYLMEISSYNLCSTNSKTWALVDLEWRTLYAFQFELNTDEGESVREAWLVPS